MAEATIKLCITAFTIWKLFIYHIEKYFKHELQSGCIPSQRAVLKAVFKLKSELYVNSSHYLDIYIHMAKISEVYYKYICVQDVNLYSNIWHHIDLFMIFSLPPLWLSISFFLPCSKKSFLLHNNSYQNNGISHVFRMWMCRILGNGHILKWIHDIQIEFSKLTIIWKWYRKYMILKINT